MKRKEGFIFIDSVFAYDEKLSDSEKLMIGKIQGYCIASNGNCFLSASELGSQLAWDGRKSKRIIASLEKNGYIVRERIGHNYSIRIGDSVSISEDKVVVTKMTPKGDKNDTIKVTKMTPQGDKNDTLSDKFDTLSDKNDTSFIYKRNINETIKEDITKSDREKIITEEEKLFFSFWEAYPKKVDKKGSLRAFKNISHLKKVYPDIMRALSVQKNSRQWQEQNGRFIPNPTTYIHQERWLSVNEAEEKEDISQKIAAEALKSWGWLKEGDGFDEQESFY